MFALALSAQEGSVSTRTAVDINGRRVTEGPQVSQAKSQNASETTETMQSINGRKVPLERVEERVLRDDASGRVVERLIQRYDATGNPTTPVKETIEEQKRPDGSSTIQTTTYRGDINGRMQLLEKSTTELHKSDSTQTSETVVQRPTLNGSLETVEKRSGVSVKDSAGIHEETTTYRRDGNGGFAVAVRQTKQHTEQGAQASDNTAEYEIGANGRLQLHSQTVARTATRPDGSKEIELNIYGNNVPGTVDASGGKMKLHEQQLIEKKPGPGDTLVETVSVRRPTVSDPNLLGPPRQLSETICKGKCGN